MSGSILDAGFHMVIDVESVGLHGDAFAFGWVVICENGAVEKHPSTGLRHHDSAKFDWRSCSGKRDGFEWVAKNIGAPAPSECLATRREVRERFWEAWTGWRNQGCLLWADVPWPVEARFLLECVGDYRHAGYISAELTAPYPLLDVNTLAASLGFSEIPRIPEELPEHDPLNDAKHSARKLARCLQKLRGENLAGKNGTVGS